MGLRAQAADQHREEPPPLYIRESRPNPATVDVNQTDQTDTVSGLVYRSRPEVVRRSS